MRVKRPDRKNAISIIEAAERDMGFTLTLPVTEESAATVVRNIYGSFRMLGDALLVNKGIQSEDHILPINELTTMEVKVNRPLHLIDNLRRLRHNINYYGYKPKVEEVREAIALSKELFAPLAKEVRRRLK